MWLSPLPPNIKKTLDYHQESFLCLGFIMDLELKKYFIIRGLVFLGPRF